MLPVVILAGGLATRLYPVTLEIPKSLIEINGTPFIHHQLLLLKEKGVSEVVLCVGHMGEEIESFVGDGSQYGLHVRYSYDGDFLLGTGGAVKKASELLEGAFMIQYGDSYLDVDYESVEQSFRECNLPILMTVYNNKNTLDTSNVQMENGMIVKYEKNSLDPTVQYIDYGLLVVKKTVFDSYITEKPFDLSMVLSDYVIVKKVAAYEILNRFYEIGSIQGIKDTAEYIRIRNHI